MDIFYTASFVSSLNARLYVYATLHLRDVTGAPVVEVPVVELIPLVREVQAVDDLTIFCADWIHICR